MSLVSFKKLTDNAKVPSKGSEYAAGFDLYSDVDTVVPRRSRAIISTGIAMCIPEDHFGKIESRSSIASKGVITGAGVIDSDYRGEVRVLLLNLTDEDYPVVKGDRIAQLIIHKLPKVTFFECDELPGSVRGENGFGSTGK